MSSSLSRRHFIVSLGAVGAASALPINTLAGVFPPPLYPSLELSHSQRPIAPAPAQILFGYAAITWGGNDLQAIKEISEIGSSRPTTIRH